ncbi:MAG TPA: hypothetical protein H9759_08100 [Candidatus Dietzia intestinipullorum]|nr:hypothetical protein [Candidatus Dietzia intestinipullorum]
MKKIVSMLATTLLVLAGCATDSGASDNSGVAAPATSAAPEVHALSDTVTVGGVIISDMEISTEGCVFAFPPAQDAVKFQLVATVENGTQEEIMEVLWPTDITFTDPDGMSVKPTDISQGEQPCVSDHPREFNRMTAGEKRRAAVTIEAPAGAQEMIYSTSLIEGAEPVRWDVADEVAVMEVVSPESSATEAAQSTPETVPAAPTASTGEGVIGFTEAPGHGSPTQMNKTISYCGDPGLHETGTTFFTDGTSGWTQTCASQMMQAAPAAPAKPPEVQAEANAGQSWWGECMAANTAEYCRANDPWQN